MKLKNIIYCSISLTLFSCSNSYSEIENMNWLEGKWTSNVKGNDVSESWTKTNDSTWTGVSEFSKDGEVLFSEEMSVSKRNGVFSFISSSSDKNDGEAVEFVAKKITKNKVIFENKAHDFPQQIVYEKNHKDSMLAYISGDFAGQTRRIDFRMSKVK